MENTIVHKSSLKGRILREILRKMILKGGKDMIYDLPEPSAKPETPWTVPEGYEHWTEYAGDVPLEFFGTTAGKASGKLILQFHGGGYMAGVANDRRNICIRYSRECGNATIVMPDYRIAPAHTYPAGLDDGLAAWDRLLVLGYKAKDIVVASDSAGGNLALAVIMKLRDSGKELPAALFSMSPWGDMSLSGASYYFNYYRDAFFGKPKRYLPLEPVPKRTPAYAGDTPLDDPFLSPVFGKYDAFPPMLLQTGTWELLLSDSITIHAKALAAGCDSHLSLYEGMFHAFQFGLDRFYESRTAWKEAGVFIRKYLFD